MAGGAAFTEPDIHLPTVARGNSRTARRWWSKASARLPALEHPLYSRFLNSLDHRNRVVSRTAITAPSATAGTASCWPARPGAPGYDWFRHRGPPVGLFVMRFLQADAVPALPNVRRSGSTFGGPAMTWRPAERTTVAKPDLRRSRRRTAPTGGTLPTRRGAAIMERAKRVALELLHRAGRPGWDAFLGSAAEAG